MTSACLEQGGGLLEQKEDSPGIVEGNLAVILKNAMQLHYIWRLDACGKALIRLKFTSQSQVRGLVLGDDLLGCDLETQYASRVHHGFMSHHGVMVKGHVGSGTVSVLCTLTYTAHCYCR
jgi:hypothetical protein